MKEIPLLMTFNYQEFEISKDYLVHKAKPGNKIYRDDQELLDCLLPTINESVIKCKYWVEVHIKHRGIGVVRPPPAKFDIIMGVDSIYRDLFAGDDDSNNEEGGKLIRYQTSKSAAISKSNAGLMQMWEDNSKKVR